MKKTKAIENALKRAREIVQQAKAQPPIDVERLARELGAEVRYQHLDEGTSGYFVKPKTGQPVIGVNADHHPHRQRFTLAHELGHMVLHAKRPTVLVDEAIVHFRDQVSADATNPVEREANAFASELLMPEPFVRAQLGNHRIDVFDDDAVRSLAKLFLVSPQAITLRLKRLDLVGD